MARSILDSYEQRVKKTDSEVLYLAHFGLVTAPFGTTPDTRYYFAHRSSNEAMNTLLVATRGGEGFVKVTGEIGTGKTLLCRAFLNALDERCMTAYIPNPYLEPMTLLLAVADELGVHYPPQANQHQVLKALTSFLIDSHARHQGVVVLCLDEAHAMPLESLEALRLLSNLETQRRKLLQIVLFGQPELDHHLEQSSLRQLRQRIAFSARLQPLDISSVQDYLAHRLSIAGHRGVRLFDAAAVKRLHQASGGAPRLINILAHKAMMAAYGEGVHQLSCKHVRWAIADTESVADSGGRWSRRFGSLLGAAWRGVST